MHSHVIYVCASYIRIHCRATRLDRCFTASGVRMYACVRHGTYIILHILYLQLRSCGSHSVLIPHARIVFRLYWFITKALYSSAHVSRLTCINIAFYLPFNVMLFALYLMQVYWFIFIVKLLIKVSTLGIDDITRIKSKCIITYTYMVWKLSIYSTFTSNTRMVRHCFLITGATMLYNIYA